MTPWDRMGGKLLGPSPNLLLRPTRIVVLIVKIQMRGGSLARGTRLDLIPKEIEGHRLQVKEAEQLQEREVNSSVVITLTTFQEAVRCSSERGTLPGQLPERPLWSLRLPPTAPNSGRPPGG